jgi:hypothetical protein
VLARLVPYRTPPAEVEPLVDEIVALARSAGSAVTRARRAEFFFLDRPTGNGLSIVLAEDETVPPVIDLGQPPSGDPEHYDVRLLQVGGPEGSGVVPNLHGRVVRYDGDDPSPDPPTSPDVWARAFLAAPGGRVALAVATSREALGESLRACEAGSTGVEDYDDVAYHFFFDN